MTEMPTIQPAGAVTIQASSGSTTQSVRGPPLTNYAAAPSRHLCRGALATGA